MNDPGRERQWRWDGSRWLWWNGYSWQEGGPEAHEVPPPPAPRRGLSTGGIVAIALGAILALVLVGGGVALIYALTTGDDAEDTVTLQTERISSAVDAFTPPAGNDTAVAAAPVAGVQSASAATPGLYGGTLDTATCNKDQLVAYLVENPDKAAAWAGVLGIAPNQIAEFVKPLTPVILRSDLAVTNHGFERGKATSVPAVLQAGTAVLVNTYGQPVVKCYCGNPLTPAAAMPANVRYTGPTWPTFVPGAFQVVQPAPQVITVFVLTNVVTGDLFDRPSGTTGAADVSAAEKQAAADKAAADKAAADKAAADAAAAAAAQAAEDARAAAASEGVTSSQAVGLLMGRLDACAIAVLGNATEYTPVGQDPALSFSAAPGAGAGLYRVTMTESSSGSSYTFTVNVATGAVTAGDEGAAGIEMECPGVFD